MNDWHPSPGVEGYIINHLPGGTVISASSLGELGKAVDAFISSATPEDGKLSAPIGIQTDYPIMSHSK